MDTLRVDVDTVSLIFVFVGKNGCGGAQKRLGGKASRSASAGA
jgi:hypothetical protein